jgi:carboxyl-terminal processing protease
MDISRQYPMFCNVFPPQTYFPTLPLVFPPLYPLASAAPSPFFIMTLNLRPSLSLLTVVLLGCTMPPLSQADSDRTDYGQVAGAVANMLMENHYSMQDFDDKLSARALQNFFDYLDYPRLYFTQSEVEGFRALYETKLDDFVFQYKIQPAKEIHALYAKKIKARFVKIKELLEGGKLDFNTDLTTELSRKDLPWPANEADLDDLWKRQITREVLQERLILARAAERKKAKAASLPAAPSGDAPKPATPEAPPAAPEAKPAGDPAAAPPPVTGNPSTPVPKTASKDKSVPDTPEQKVLKRYQTFLEAINEQDDEDVTNFLLSCIATAYDPHSEYLSAPENDRFQIEMKKSLIGIGAVLQRKDGAAEIMSLVPGGPADKSGGLHVGDLITGVGQGLDGEILSTDGLKLEKIVSMIRGEENTTVKLKIQSVDDPTTFRELKIVRAKVEIKDSIAKAELIELNEPSGDPLRIGWIELDSFYADMENMNKRNAVSATAHVKLLLNRLMKENISGLVLDLRRNGGGSLEEAIRLTGLFMKSGPVVQQRDSRDRVEPRFSRSAEPLYSGPLIVVTDRASASASEICAAALQDYGRAVVLGDKATFGKGTVQTILGVGEHMPLFSDKSRAGTLKVTIQKFYRINGETTQREGVKADVVLPSRYDARDLGESFLKEPLPSDKIPKMNYDKAPNAPLPLEALRAKSAERVSKNPEFQYLTELTARNEELIRKNTISLNEALRLKEDLETEARFEQQKAERKARVAAANKGGDPYKVFPLTVDTVNQVTLKTDTEVKAEEKSKPNPNATADLDGDDAEVKEETFPHGIEPVKAEGLEVMRDLIQLTSPAKGTAKSD